MILLTGGVSVEVAGPGPAIAAVAVIQGPKGDTGPTGPTGPPGSGSGIEIPQLTPSSSWVLAVPAEYDRRPSVTVYLTSGEQILTDVVSTLTQVSVTFATPTTGSVIIN